jgi:hypothetical protein
MWMHRSSSAYFYLARFGTDYQKAQDITTICSSCTTYGDPRFEPDIYTTRAMRLLCIQQNQPEMAEPLLVRLEHEAESSGDLTMMPKRVIIATFFSPGRVVVTRKLLWSVPKDYYYE